MQVLPINSSKFNYNQRSAMQSPSFGTRLDPASRRKIFGWLELSGQDFMSKHGNGLNAKLKRLRNDGHSEDVINFRQEINQRSNSSTKLKRLQNGIFFISIPCVQKRYIPVLTIKRGDIKLQIDLPITVRGKKAGDIANSKSFARFLDALTPEKIEKYRQAAIRNSKKRE